jgi:ABC-2 type transport system ATP-binding protein
MVAIEVKDLVKNYGSFRAVDHISFTVQIGEIFGLIGPNGAGKTTTLRTLSTLLKITSGSATIFGNDIAKKPGEIRQIISYLPEDAGAYKNLTGKEYLEFISSFFGNRAIAKNMLEKGVSIAKLKERINDKVETYSKGMMRRLLVARALMIEPQLAILDEPTSGLDVINAQEVRGLIRNFAKNKEKDTAVLLSSHNMLEVEFLCDRIALINDGKILVTGSPKVLKKKYKAKNIEEVFMRVVGVESVEGVV